MSGPRTRPLVLPTARGWGCIVVGFAFVYGAGPIGIPDLVWAGLLLLGVVALGLATIGLEVVRSRFDVVESAPQMVRTGETATVELGISQRLRSPKPVVTVVDQAAHFGALRLVIPRVGSTATVRYDVDSSHRGELNLAPATIRFEDPFGVVRGRTTVGDGVQILVLPRMLQGIGPAQSDDPAGTIDDLAQSDLGMTPDGDLRAYRSGDPLRRIHWRQSARQGELLVRTEHDESGAAGRVLLLTVRACYGDAPDGLAETSPSFERAVSAGATFAARLIEQRSGVDFSVVGAHPERFMAKDPTTLLAALARVAIDAPDDELDREGLLEWSFGDGTRSSTIVVTGTVTPRLAEALSKVVMSRGVLVTTLPGPYDERQIESLHRSGWRVVPIAADEHESPTFESSQQ